MILNRVKCEKESIRKRARCENESFNKKWNRLKKSEIGERIDLKRVGCENKLIVKECDARTN